jgi:virulence factor
MDRLRMGVIGAGRMGQRHCRVYSSLRRSELAGVYDRDAVVGGQVAQQYDAPFYASLDELLQQVDGVSIAASTPSHFEIAQHCLERGVHVLIEKPMTETLLQAQILADAAERSGLVVMVGHIERFNPAYVELKNVLGHMTPLAVELRRLSPYERSNQDVDVVLDLMIHDIDLALDLSGAFPVSNGSPASGGAEGATRVPYLVSTYGLSLFGALDHAVAHLALTRASASSTRSATRDLYGAAPLLTLIASRVTEQKIRSIQVTAAEAFLECDLLNKQIAVHRHTIGEYLPQDTRVKYRQESVVERIHVPASEPLAMELEHFVSCIQNGTKPLVPAAAGLASLNLAHAVRSAIGNSMVITLQKAETAEPLAAGEPALLPGVWPAQTGAIRAGWPAAKFTSVEA